jgi:hypothetical protein
MAPLKPFAVRKRRMVGLAPHLLAGVIIVLLLEHLSLFAGVTDWSSHNPGAAVSMSTADRYGKGDRLSSSSAENGPIAVIVSVEIVGLRNAAIVYRDRNGQVLFRSDPLTNTTMVSKNADLPEVTVRDDKDVAVRPVPVEVQPNTARTKLPIGCESSLGPLAERSPRTLASRCVTQSSGASKFAALW